MRKIRVAQIGAEHDHSYLIMNSLRKQTDVFDVIGYAVPDGEKNINPKIYDGLPQLTVEEIFNDTALDAVIIETGEKNLTKYALMAAERGISVHMDKPGGYELADFEKLIGTVKEKKTVFHTGYMYRYNPAVRKIQERIKNGELGEIYSVEAQMSCEHTDAKRAWLGDFPGGMMFYLGCHLIDMICLFRGIPDEVIPFNANTGINGNTSEDYGFAVLKYPNGVSFAKSCAAERGGFTRRQLVVCGSRGTVELKPFEHLVDPGRGTDQHTHVRECITPGRSWSFDGVQYHCEPFDRYDSMMRSFAEYVVGEKENPYSPDYELAVYSTMLKACGKIK